MITLVFIFLSALAPDKLYGMEPCDSSLSTAKTQTKFERLVERLNNPALIERLAKNSGPDILLLRKALNKKILSPQLESELFFINWGRITEGGKMTLNIATIYVLSRSAPLQAGERKTDLGGQFAIFLTGTLLGVKDYLKLNPQITAVEVIGSTIVNPHLIEWLKDYGFQQDERGLSIKVEGELLNRLRAG